MKITQAEIDSTIERSNQWTRHRVAMQIIGTALRAQNDGRCLGDILTVEQIELVAMGGPNAMGSLRDMLGACLLKLAER